MEGFEVSGLIFLYTENLDKIVDFYVSKVGAKVWLEQPDCTILQHGNLLLGFCDKQPVHTCGVITFFYESTDEVDQMFEKLRSRAINEPHKSEGYNIYQFFAKDPEGRKIEFQCFLHELPETPR